MSRLGLLFLALTLLAATGCSSIRGERVETGAGSSVELIAAEASSAGLLDVELASATDTRTGLSPALAAVQARPVPVDLGRGDASISFDFEARELYSGSIVEGADLFGQGSVLVTFVQPGCEITLAGGSTIAEVAEEHPEAIFVIIHSGADDEAYMAFAEKAMLFQENMIHLSDTYGSLAQRYGVDAYPTTLLIDEELRITAVAGVMDDESQRQAVEAVTSR